MLNKARRGITQERGRARRLALLEAASELLGCRDIDEMALADVAAAAGIPKSSSYHFYSDIHELYAELASMQDVELHARLEEPILNMDRWEDILIEFVRRAATFFRETPSAQQLMFGPKTPPDIKRAGRTADIGHGTVLENQINRQFVVHLPTDRLPVFFHAVEAIDLMFGLSLIEFGELTDRMVDEAAKMAISYLSLYIPQLPPRR